MISERLIQANILRYLRIMHVFCWRNNTGRRGGVSYGRIGSADILGILKPSGRLLAIEVKKPGGKPTEDQLAFLWAVRDAGGVAIVATDVDDVRKVLYPPQVPRTMP